MACGQTDATLILAGRSPNHNHKHNFT